MITNEDGESEEVEPAKRVLGYVNFARTVKMSVVKEMFQGSSSWSPRFNTHEYVINYLMDSTNVEDGWEVLKPGAKTFGNEETAPPSGPVGRKKADDKYSRLKAIIDEGGDDEEIADMDFKMFLQHHKSISVYRHMKSPKRRTKTQVVVIHGETGSGKSMFVSNLFGSDTDNKVFWKRKGVWWDGYKGQDIVVIDEFYGWIPFDEMLRLLDRYPLTVETKGGCQNFNSKIVFITSNKHPSEWYSRSWDSAPLYRRLDVIIRKDCGKPFVFEKPTMGGDEAKQRDAFKVLMGVTPDSTRKLPDESQCELEDLDNPIYVDEVSEAQYIKVLVDKGMTEVPLDDSEAIVSKSVVLDPQYVENKRKETIKQRRERQYDGQDLKNLSKIMPVINSLLQNDPEFTSLEIDPSLFNFNSEKSQVVVPLTDKNGKRLSWDTRRKLWVKITTHPETIEMGFNKKRAGVNRPAATAATVASSSSSSSSNEGYSCASSDQSSSSSVDLVACSQSSSSLAPQCSTGVASSIPVQCSSSSSTTPVTVAPVAPSFIDESLDLESVISIGHSHSSSSSSDQQPPSKTISQKASPVSRADLAREAVASSKNGSGVKEVMGKSGQEKARTGVGLLHSKGVVKNSKGEVVSVIRHQTAKPPSRTEKRVPVTSTIKRTVKDHYQPKLKFPLSVKESVQVAKALEKVCSTASELADLARIKSLHQEALETSSDAEEHDVLLLAHQASASLASKLISTEDDAQNAQRVIDITASCPSSILSLSASSSSSSASADDDLVDSSVVDLVDPSDPTSPMFDDDEAVDDDHDVDHDNDDDDDFQ